MNKKKLKKAHKVDNELSMRFFAKTGLGVYKGSICFKVREMFKTKQRHFLKLMMRKPRK